MLWVDQPIGTGLTTGTPKATTQEETAQDFVGFFKNFEELFGIKNYKIYVTGESCKRGSKLDVVACILTLLQMLADMFRMSLTSAFELTLTSSKLHLSRHARPERQGIL